jgi:hypothetical protein
VERRKLERAARAQQAGQGRKRMVVPPRIRALAKPARAASMSPNSDPIDRRDS